MNSKELKSKKITELKEMAKELNIEKYYKLNKTQLVQIINMRLSSGEIVSESDDMDKDGITAERKRKKINKSEKKTYKEKSQEMNKSDKNDENNDINKNVVATISEDIKKYIEKDEENVYVIDEEEILTSSEKKDKEDKEDKKGNRTIDPKDLILGTLDVMDQGYGFVRTNNREHSRTDSYIPKNLIDRFKLKSGDKLSCLTRQNPDNEKSDAVVWVQTINGVDTSDAIKIKRFDKLVPIFPDKIINLETGQNDLSMRIINLMSPIGKGQRGLIVSPPKAGKTTIIKNIANAIKSNYKEIELIILLIDERPEEVTDMQYSVDGAQIVYSTFDERPENHVQTAEVILERAKRLVEHGKDVVILLDSITRLSRAYNLVVPSSGRTLSGGLDPTALYGPKRFFGAARNIKGGGSLTILATALVDTGSRMDDIIFEEFKGTGNMEIHLSRHLSERRIFPAIDISKSGTRRDEKLLTRQEQEVNKILRRELTTSNSAIITQKLLKSMDSTDSNEEFVKKFLFKNKTKIK